MDNLKILQELQCKLIGGVQYEEKKAEVFIWYSGHTNQIDIRLHYNKWVSGENEDLRLCIYLDSEVTNIDEHFSKINNALKLIESKYRVELN